MPTESQVSMMNNYALLMEEAKQRIDWLNILLSGNTGLPNTAIQEFGFLQLRILCELIALGCLTAHGDLAETKAKSFRDEWNATNILNRLQRLHAEFYPHPVSVRELGPGRKHLDEITSGHLSKSELISLYGRSSDLIHRGSVSKLLTPTPPWPPDNSELLQWGQKIVTLLSHHHIGHLGGATHMICLLKNQSDSNRVQVTFAEALSPEAAAALPPLPHPGPIVLPGLHPSKPWKPGK
jgi:hypothetical protein